MTSAQRYSKTVCPRLNDKMTHAILEHAFTCPYCWEPITMLLDLSVADQRYVEDCEVCCNPISLSFRADQGTIVAFDAQQMS